MTQIADAFHCLYYDSRVWQRTYWLGHRCTKYPADMWAYQEIISETRPNLVIETGTYAGGSALFLASLFDLPALAALHTLIVASGGSRHVHAAANPLRNSGCGGRRQDFRPKLT